LHLTIEPKKTRKENNPDTCLNIQQGVYTRNVLLWMSSGKEQKSYPKINVSEETMCHIPKLRKIEPRIVVERIFKSHEDIFGQSPKVQNDEFLK